MNNVATAPVLASSVAPVVVPAVAPVDPGRSPVPLEDTGADDDQIVVPGNMTTNL